MSKNNDVNPFFNKIKGKNTQENAQKDNFGNLLGNEFDLAKDNAFKGKNIAVLHLYTGEGFDFSFPTKALEEKGFSITRWQNSPPKIDEFKSVLASSSQLWVISSNHKVLTNEYLIAIKDFFDKGHGVFIWGDNLPYYEDANYISESLLDTTMSGNIPGDKVVSLQKEKNKAGLIKNHEITTGIEYLYEGVTVATIKPSKDLKPLMFGSDNNLITAYFDKDGKRALIDGGFTRLFIKWDTAGTGRFVKNAAAWLSNIERFENIEIKKPNNLIKPKIDDFDFTPNNIQQKKQKPKEVVKPKIDDFDF